MSFIRSSIVPYLYIGSEFQMMNKTRRVEVVRPAEKPQQRRPKRCHLCKRMFTFDKYVPFRTYRMNILSSVVVQLSRRWRNRAVAPMATGIRLIEQGRAFPSRCQRRKQEKWQLQAFLMLAKALGLRMFPMPVSSQEYK